MASSLDLQEQEQLDQLKAFWNRYGNAITWGLTLVLAAFAAWNGWNWWQREQAVKAAGLYAELDKAAVAGDAARVGTAWNDLQARFPKTHQAVQGGLLAAKVLADKGQPDPAAQALRWVADQTLDPLAATVAQTRMAALQLQQKQLAEALATLKRAEGKGLDGLVFDLRGDAHLLMNDRAAAKEAYRAAWAALPTELEYRRVLEAKLMGLGVNPLEEGK